MKKPTVLVVDDSLLMRTILSKMFSDNGFDVIGYAINGKEGVLKAIKLQPDLITMDVEMPVMDGIQAVKEIMTHSPIPILMVSSLTIQGAKVTVDALAEGALDFVTKRQSDPKGMEAELIQKSKAILNDIKNKDVDNNNNTNNFALKSVFNSQDEKVVTQKESSKKNINILGKQRPKPEEIRAILIGISTGGPMTLLELISKLPEDFKTPIIICQHMPPNFTNSLATRLDGITKLNVKEAEDNEKIEYGHIYIAPGGRQINFNKHNRIIINDNKPENDLYSPSVNVMFNSAIDVWKKNILCLIMTGMGHDGTSALKRLQSIGGYAISQDIESSVIAGMTRSAIEAKVVDEIHPLSQLALVLNTICKR